LGEDLNYLRGWAWEDGYAYFEIQYATTLTTRRAAPAVMVVDGCTAAFKVMKGFLRRASIERFDHEGTRFPQSPTLDPNERVLAVRALSEAVKANKIQFLRGLLYWRLSTMEREREYEPYLAVLGSQEDQEFFKVLREVAGVRLPSDEPSTKDNRQLTKE
jgi:hypothetical protein